VRKVRAPQGTVLGNTQAGRPDGIGPQKQTASGRQLAVSGWLLATGKGEKVVQETTGARGDTGGQATPTGSKAKQGRDPLRRARGGPSRLSPG